MDLAIVLAMDLAMDLAIVLAMNKVAGEEIVGEGVPGMEGRGIIDLWPHCVPAGVVGKP